MSYDKGLNELRGAMGKCRWHFVAVGVFSIFVNLLMLTGPLFMLQIYDRVLSSRSEATLTALLLLVTVLFAFMGVLEYVRGRVLARAGAKFQSLLDKRVFVAVLRRALAPSDRAQPNTAARDLDSVRHVLSGPAPFAVFDLPWTPIFILAIFIFHPILGWTAVVGALILIVLTALNQVRSREPNLESQKASFAAEQLGEALRQNAEAVRGLGMRETGLGRWQALRDRALETQIEASDRTASYASASKSLRFYLQSLMLAIGALLAIRGEISPGMMIAGSILLGRALAPIEQAIGQWAAIQRAKRGWQSLSELLEKTPEEPHRTALPAPKGLVEVLKIAVAAPGEQKPALMGIDFKVEPGQALGVIGPSGAGKTTLAKVLTGIWRPAHGKVRIDGAPLQQWAEDQLGKHLGYLPQEIGLVAGTVAENIARLSPQPDDAKVVQAAQRAGAHELLLELPQGYETDIGANGQRLSGGQRQRVALARALYDDPPVLVLDEPNANLDAQGEQALVDAIRDAKSRGRTVIIMAHRPSAIAACDLLLMIDKGKQVDYGPRDEVLKRRTKNYSQLVSRTGGQPGGAPAAPNPGGDQPQPSPAAAQQIAQAAQPEVSPFGGGGITVTPTVTANFVTRKKRAEIAEEAPAEETAAESTAAERMASEATAAKATDAAITGHDADERVAAESLPDPEDRMPEASAEDASLAEATKTGEVQPLEVAEHEPADAAEPEPVEATQAEPVEAAEPEPAEMAEHEPVEAVEPERAAVAETKPLEGVEPEPVAESEPVETAAEPEPELAETAERERVEETALYDEDKATGEDGAEDERRLAASLQPADEEDEAKAEAAFAEPVEEERLPRWTAGGHQETQSSDGDDVLTHEEKQDGENVLVLGGDTRLERQRMRGPRPMPGRGSRPSAEPDQPSSKMAPDDFGPSDDDAWDETAIEIDDASIDRTRKVSGDA